LAKNYDGRKPYGEVSKIVTEMKSEYPWINRHVVNNSFNIYQQNMAKEGLSVEEESETDDSLEVKKASRPSGTTAEARLKKETVIYLAHYSMAIEYDARKKETKSQRCKDGKMLAKYADLGCLDKIVEKFKKKYGLDNNVEMSRETIRSRSYKNRRIVKGMGPVSPMEEVEPILIDLIIKMSNIRRYLTLTQRLFLANDLIAGTETEKRWLNLRRIVTRTKYMRRHVLECHIGLVSRKGGIIK